MSRFSRWLALPPLTYLGLLFALPALLMVVASFQWPGEFGGLEPLLERTAEGARLNLTLENYQRLGEDGLYLELLLKSFGYAAVTTAICLLLGYPLATLIARSPVSWRSGLLLLVVLPFWSNFLIRIYAWMILLSPEGVLLGGLNALLALLGLGPLQLMYTPAAVIICMVYVHLPFMVLPLFVNLERQDPALIEAARDLGAKRWQRFWRVTWPLSLPGVYAGAALVFIPAFGMFAIPDLVGGTEGIMIGNVIRAQFLEARDWPFGSTLSIALTIVILALALMAAWLARGRAGHG
jgi:spermidine/putrescine transport system permease protein